MREGWTYKRFTEVCDVQYGYPFDSKCFTDDSNYMPLIRIRDVQRGYSDTFYSGEIPDGYTIQEGDYLVGMDGEFNIGIWGKRPGVLNQRVCKMTSSSDFLVNKYMFYFLKVCLKKIEDETPFVTVKHLSAKRINQIEIPLPPKSQQEAIVSELDEINSLLALKREQLQKYDKLAQSLFYEMFGDPVENEKGWEVKKLEQLIEIGAILYHLDGNHGGDYPRSEEFTKTGVPYIGANSINNGVIDFNLAKYLPEERAKMLKKGICQNEDVLFAHNATVGPVAILFSDCKVILSTSLTAYRCNKDFLLPYFLKMYMESNWFVCQYIGTMKQTTRNQIPITKQRKMKFIIPPLPLQQQFASRIEQIESQKQQVQAAIEKLETLLASRMQYWFE